MITFIIAFVLIGLYGWLTAIGFGLALLRLLPKMTLVKQALRLAMPVWGISNVFLIASLFALAAFFRRTAEELFLSVQPILIVSVLLLGLHSALVIGLFYRNAKTGFRLANIIYAVTSLLLPVTFSTAAIRLLTGGQFWQSAYGWSLVLLIMFGLTAIAVTFVYYVVGHTPHDRLHMLSRRLNIGFSLLLTLGIIFAVRDTDIHFRSAAVPYLIGIALSISLVQLLLVAIRRERYAWWYVSVLAVGTPLLIAAADYRNLLLLR